MATVNVTSKTEHLTRYDGKSVVRTTYRVNRRICCSLETLPDRYRVALGKPSDASVLSWYYDKNAAGLKQAQAKVKAICDSTVQWYESILQTN